MERTNFGLLLAKIEDEGELSGWRRDPQNLRIFKNEMLTQHSATLSPPDNRLACCQDFAYTY